MGDTQVIAVDQHLIAFAEGGVRAGYDRSRDIDAADEREVPHDLADAGRR